MGRAAGRGVRHGRAVVAGLADDYFATIVHEHLASGHGRQRLVGDAPSVLVEAAVCRFAVEWLERSSG